MYTEIQSKMLINGAFTEGESASTFIVRNPATGDLLKSYPCAGRADVENAVSIASEGFRIWKRTPTEDRAKIIHKAASLVRSRLEEFAKAITREMGKPLSEARSEVASSADLLDYFAEEGIRVQGDIPKMDLSAELPLIVKEPVGVVAAITPFNYPMGLLVWKLGPALITGCTVIAKPDIHAPTAVLLLAQAFLEAGLPINIFQVLTGDGSTGELLVEHPGVQKIAFTGSSTVGQEIASVAGGLGKRFTLELGGQCPAIVAEGADLSSVVPSFVKHAFNNAGQYCYRINRAYVLESVYESFVAELLNAVKRIKLGNGETDDVSMGPLCHEGVYTKTENHVRDSLSKGGELLYGGCRLEASDFSRGFYFLPTVITNTNHDMLVMNEETFGPVVGIQKVKTLGEAIALANDSVYGLAAYVFTGDSGIGLQIARELEVGSVWVNRVQKAYFLCPFGGVKQSGKGREKSKYGLDEYLELKTIYLGLPDAKQLL